MRGTLYRGGTISGPPQGNMSCLWERAQGNRVVMGEGLYFICVDLRQVVRWGPYKTVDEALEAIPLLRDSMGDAVLGGFEIYQLPERILTPPFP